MTGDGAQVAAEAGEQLAALQQLVADLDQRFPLDRHFLSGRKHRGAALDGDELCRVDAHSLTLSNVRFDVEWVPLERDAPTDERHRPEVEATLLTEGFELVDVRNAPDRPDREFVFIARRSP